MDIPPMGDVVILNRTVGMEFANFKHAIGDRVAHVTNPRWPWVVVERLIGQTKGGYDRIYKVTSMYEGEVDNTLSYEHELIPYEQPLDEDFEDDDEE